MCAVEWGDVRLGGRAARVKLFFRQGHNRICQLQRNTEEEGKEKKKLKRYVTNEMHPHPWIVDGHRKLITS